jgi:hypothetical protein
MRLEFRELVQKQYAVMRERDLAGLGAQAAADKCGHACGMVRSAERPAARQRALGDLAGDRGDHRNFEQLLRRERRQDRGQPRGQHRFARTGRADHQKIVAACRGDLERALRALLALNVF